MNKTMVLPSIDNATGIRVDFIFSHSSYEKQAIERAKTVAFNKTPVRIASLEDVIIHKIIAGRPRDMEDIEAILLKNPDYDRRYILNWLKQFDQSLHQGFCQIFEEAEKQVK